jgi:hypothetical protein
VGAGGGGGGGGSRSVYLMRNVCSEICKLSLMISRVLLFEILLLCLLKFSCATSLEEEEEEEE